MTNTARWALTALGMFVFMLGLDWTEGATLNSLRVLFDLTWALGTGYVLVFYVWRWLGLWV
jgi:hypothetical protein